MRSPEAPTRNPIPADPRRRQVLKLLSVGGAGSIVFGRALVTLAADKPGVTEAMVRRAEWIAGIELTREERKLMLGGLDDLLADFKSLREIPLDNGVAPALLFRPRDSEPERPRAVASSAPVAPANGERPGTDDELAYADAGTLAALLRSRQISSTELTRLYLDRLRRFDPELHCVIHLTEDLALEQAARADRELSAGRDRGPLHGIPWGAKDLLAVPGYPTTWGATPYRDQVREDEATVATRLAEAGAVLVAKLSVGALAWGDVWFGGTTRNPWDLEQGSSGSSAGPAAATAAGLVAFAIGTETWGSIVSPCTRCGVSGLRPTFGRVSRHGVMALSWSMDKIGPIARSVEDCALVFDAIRGPDGRDRSVVSHPFVWPPERDPRTLKLAYAAELFEDDRASETDDAERRAQLVEWQELDRSTLGMLRGIGFRMVPIELPQSYPVGSLGFILTAEAATAFDELSRSGKDDLLVRQVEQAWPNVLRQGQMIPAVEYLRANRIRSLLMQEMEALMADVDVYISPTYAGDNLLLTNLTGHPAVVLPNGFRADGTPTSITFTGRLDGEAELLAVARAYQQATEFHLRRPPLGRKDA